MKKIPLTQGKFAIVDDQDYPWLRLWKWFALNQGKHWYAIHSDYGRPVRMHRLILGAKKGQEVDHVNGDGLDNRRSNLRICTKAQNQMNSRLQRREKSSRFKGVYWDKIHRKWKAQIKLKDRRKALGYFFDEVDAAKAYDYAARHYFGEFALTNFQMGELEK